MSRIVFCEIAWMKYYKNFIEDVPKNGREYINKSGEVCNFFPCNHKCYGYIMPYDGELHIERYGEKYRNKDQIDDITVVWVASDGQNYKIVGWYEHATMYRNWQYYWQLFKGCYNLIADEKDCYLIEESDRSFIIPRASQTRNGIGMGKSQIWYADDPDTQIEFVPKVLEYLDSMRDKCEPIYYDPQELEKCAEDHGKSVDELLDVMVENLESKRAYNLKNKDDEKLMVHTLHLANLAVAIDDAPDTRFFKGEVLYTMNLVFEAEEEYKKSLYYNRNLVALERLMILEGRVGRTFAAIELGEELRARKDEYEEWASDAEYLYLFYCREKEWELAKQLVQECENDSNEKHVYDWLDHAKEDIAYHEERGDL